MEQDIILVQKDGPVAKIVINRPQKRNALSLDAYRLLNQAVDRIADDNTVRVVVITGTGKSFCAGADLDELLVASEKVEAVRARSLVTHRFLGKLASLPLPVVAAINGDAVGGGASLALACDLRFAARSARLGITHMRVGVTPEMGITYFLPRLVGTARACELCFLSPILTADEAMSLGLVNRVVEDDQLEAAVSEVAGRLAATPAITMALTKKAIYRGTTSELEVVLEEDINNLCACLPSSDCREGLRAFLEKRRPQFGATR